MKLKLKSTRKRLFSAIQTNLVFSVGILLCAVLINVNAARAQASFSTQPASIAARPDSAAANVTITQSSSMTVTPMNSVACFNQAEQRTLETSYWRAFVPTNYGVGASEILTLQTLTIGVQSATTTTGSQPLVIRIYSNSAANFPSGTRTLISTTNYTLADITAPALVTIPLTATVIPAGTPQFVVEVFSAGFPAGSPNNSFFIGSNADPETGPSYLSSTPCNTPTPVTTSSIGFPNVHYVMSLTGTTGSPTASGVTVSGRVLGTAGERPVARAKVAATNAASGERKTAITDSQGNYILEGLLAGETYVFQVSHRAYQFSPQVVSLNEDLGGFNFIANNTKVTDDK